MRNPMGQNQYNLSNTEDRSGQSNCAIKICVRLLDNVQRKRLEQNIHMHNKGKNDTWDLVAAAEAEVIIFSIDEPGGEIFLKSCLKQTKITPVLFSTENRTDCPWFIDKSTDSVECMDVLSNVHKALVKSKPNESSATNLSPSAFENLTAFITDNEYVHLSYKNFLSIYFDKIDNKIYVENPATKKISYSKLARAIHTVKPEFLTLTALSKVEFKGITKNILDYLLLKKFLWEFTIMCPEQKLLNSITGTRFKLKSWPPFSSFSHSYSHVLTAAFLKKYIANVATVTTSIDVSEQSVINVINAAHITNGLIDETCENFGKQYTVNLQPKTSKSMVKNILGKILTKVSS